MAERLTLGNSLPVYSRSVASVWRAGLSVAMATLTAQNSTFEITETTNEVETEWVGEGAVVNLCDLYTWLKVSSTFGCLSIAWVPNLTTIYHLKYDQYESGS
jgi:hypothetical protein